VLAMAAISYHLLQWAIVASNGRSSTLAVALGSDLKGKLSIAVLRCGDSPSIRQPMDRACAVCRNRAHVVRTRSAH
jgi:hypothetical protein